MRRGLLFLVLLVLIWQAHGISELERKVKNSMLARRGHETRIGGTVLARSHKGQTEEFRVLDLLSLEEMEATPVEKGAKKLTKVSERIATRGIDRGRKKHPSVDGPLPAYFMTDVGRKLRATSNTKDTQGPNFVTKFLRLEDTLGTGGFSTVFKVIDDKGKEYALKVSKKCSSSDEVLERRGAWFAMDEERLQPLLFDSRFVLQSYGFTTVRKKEEYCYCIILELAQSDWLDGVTPASVGGRALGSDLTHADFATILYGIMMAMKSLADNNVFNSDIKMQNMLLFLNPKTGTYIAKMSDLTKQMLTPIRSKSDYEHDKHTACYVERADGSVQHSCWTSLECTEKCVCTGTGTYFIRSGSFYESVAEAWAASDDTESRVPKGCASPDKETRWNLATVITTTLTGIIRPTKGVHQEGLSDLYPSHFGKLNSLLKFGDTMSLPLYTRDRPNPEGPNPMLQKAKSIGEEYTTFAKAVLSGTVDNRDIEILDPDSMSSLDEADREAMNDLLTMLRQCLRDDTSLEDVIASEYIQRHARKGDYDDYTL